MLRYSAEGNASHPFYRKSLTIGCRKRYAKRRRIGTRFTHGGSLAMAVATLTKTLIVNPAFLQEIKDSNPDLWISVGTLTEIANRADEPIRVLRKACRFSVI